MAVSEPTWSAKVDEILGTIEDETLRIDAAGVVRHALVALDAISRIHLPQDHFEEGAAARAADDKHLELAPYVLAALANTNQLLGYVAEKFPAAAAPPELPSDDDFDLEFDLVDGPTGGGVGLSHRATDAKKLTPREQVADALHAFAGMLRTRVLQFADRLSFALRQADRWPLLSELDDATHKLGKAVQAVLFGVLSVFAAEVRREEILPAYRSAVSESVSLRAAVSDLTYHIARINAALAGASQETVVPLVVAIADRLGRFAARPEYRTLRPEDKKAIIEFLSSLHGLRHRKEGVPMHAMRQAVEGFSKFLEAMSAINHREVLVVHDRQRLGDCLQRLSEAYKLGKKDPEAARGPLHAVIGDLALVQGRHPGLDELRRGLMTQPVGGAAVLDAIERLRDLVGEAVATVG